MVHWFRFVAFSASLLRLQSSSFIAQSSSTFGHFIPQLPKYQLRDTICTPYASRFPMGTYEYVPLWITMYASLGFRSLPSRINQMLSNLWTIGKDNCIWTFPEYTPAELDRNKQSSDQPLRFNPFCCNADKSVL